MIRFAHAPLPVPDPFDDPDALDELGDEIATLAAHIHAATQRLLQLLAEFDHRRGWELGGHSSCAHWLALRTGIDLGAAREKVRTARVLAGLPQISASMARGELSFSAVRALTRVATHENEEELLDFARGSTTADIERMVRGWKRGSRQDEAPWERECHESRTFSVFPGDDGMYVVKGRLPAEVGALLMRAVEAASDALYREGAAEWTAERAGNTAQGAAGGDTDTVTEAARRAEQTAEAPPTQREPRPGAGRMPWGSWPSGPWRPGLGVRQATTARPRTTPPPSAAPGPSDTRSCCTSSPRRWRPRVSRADPSWKTAHAFHLASFGGLADDRGRALRAVRTNGRSAQLKRPGGSRAMRRWCAWNAMEPARS